MKVCGKKDIHVPGCSDCEELEERVEAVEECCEDAQTKIEDKADTTYVDENVGTIEGQITEVSDALNERIDNIITSSEPSITTLWEGDLALKGDSVQLSDNVNNYDFLDVYYKTSYYSDRGYYGYIRVPADEYENYTTTIGGIDRPSTGEGIRQYLTMLSFVDDTATIQDIRRWYWDGNAASNAEDSSYLTGIGIYRIDGVKISGVDAEIADAREGVDGTIYPSLGDAIRGQIQDTRDMIPQLVKTVQGNPIVLDDAFGEVKNLDVELLPIQAGTGTPSPQNIRPITGHDSVTVGVTGINQWDEQWELGDLNGQTGGDYPANNRIRSKNYIPVLPSTEYYYKSPNNAFVCFYDAEKNYINIGNNTLTANATFTTRNDIHYMRFSPSSLYGTTYNNDISINYPSTDHDYHAYHGQSKTVTLPHTVYGAGVGVTSGSGTEKMAIVDLGDLNWVYQSNLSRFYTAGIKPTSAKPPTVQDVNAICSSYYLSASGSNGTFLIGTDGTLYIWDSAYTDATSFKNGVSGQKLCYELETPTDLQTTPTDITLYNGDNVISSDGEQTLTYVQDMAIVIRKIEAQL